MNYHHDYHAGSFSDVLKHIILITLIRALQRKETAFCYLDTHAGSGYYDLDSDPAKKTKESEFGIVKIMKLIADNNSGANIPPDLVKIYSEIVKSQHYPHYYPGSPIIAQSCLRATDKMILIECQDEEIKHLKMHFKNDKQTAIHQQDAYMALNAFLPPKEGRGIILIDPAFEKNNEWDQLIDGLKIAKSKFPNGVYAIWYPLKDHRAVNHFLNKVKHLSFSSLLNVELSIYPSDGALTLAGSGMLIINPPWKIAEEIESMLPWLWKTLSVNRSGGHSIQRWP